MKIYEGRDEVRVPLKRPAWKATPPPAFASPLARLLFTISLNLQDSRAERRCSHNLQSGHPAWWSADNCCIFLTVNIFLTEARSEPTEEIIND